MKILLVIDHFGSGGAQKQIVTLAVGLKRKGYQVEIFNYYSSIIFFREIIEKEQIKIFDSGGSKFKILNDLSILLKNNNYNYAISFLDTPNIYLLLASFTKFNLKVIISERSSYLNSRNKKNSIFKFILYIKAYKIISNSFTQANWLKKFWWLKSKILVIYNGYEINPPQNATNDVEYLLSIGRIGPEKNALNIMLAMEKFYELYGWMPKLYWAGKKDISHDGLKYLKILEDKLQINKILNQNWIWLGERKDISQLLNNCKALVHASFYEGLPNVVCEAMMHSRPVLLSNVCDHPLLIEEAKNGFLFNPYDINSILEAFVAFYSLNETQLLKMSHSARDFATKNLSIEKMINSYCKLLTN